MEGSLSEGDDPRSKLKKKTSAGSGLIARAGIVAAAQASGDADVTSPVHAYGAAELVSETDDLLASHMHFMQSREDHARLSGRQKGDVRRSASAQRSTEEDGPADLPIAFVAIVSFDLKQGPCLVCVDPPIEDSEGLPLSPLTPSDIHALRTDMPFKALPENGLAAAELFGAHRNGNQKRRAPWATPRGARGAASNVGSLWGWTMNFGSGGAGGGGKGMNARGGNAGDGDDGGDGADGDDQVNGEGTGKRRQQHHDHALFMLRLGGENLFGMSHFLRVEDPSSPRGYTQGAAVCLSRLPFFGLILQRLHSFSTDVIDRTACSLQLAEMALDLRETRFEELGHSAVYQDLPVTTALLKLKEKVLAVLRLVLLEGRVIFYSKSAAAASEAVLAVASLLPGTLPLGLGRLDPPGFGSKAYRWRKFGFPLKVFREDVPLEPLMVMAGASEVLSKSGFMAATTNSMVQAMPLADLDFLVKVDTWELVSYKTERAKAALELGEEDRAFVREMVKATKLHLGDHVNDASQAVGWEGSSAWVADQFQMLFENMITKAASCLARNGRLEEERLRAEEEDLERRKSFVEGGNKGSAMDLLAGVVSPTLDGIGISKAWQQTASWLNGSTPVPVSAALEAHGQRWADLWVETENFDVWKSSHRLDLAAIAANSDPRTRAAGSRESLVVSRSAGASGATAPSPPKASKSLVTLPHSRPRATSNLGVNGALALFGVPAGGLGFGGSLDAVGSRAGNGSLAPLSGVQAFTYESGDTYTGSWKRGRRHGIGLYEERATGNTYEVRVSLPYDGGVLVIVGQVR